MVKIDHATIRDLQVYFFVAAITSVTLFGVYVSLACLTVHRFRAAKHLPRALVRRTTAFVVFVALLFCVYVISTLAQIYHLILPLRESDWTQRGWIVGTYSSLSLTAVMGDTLFVYRCWIIWQHSRVIWAFFLLLAADACVLAVSTVFDCMDGATSTDIRVRQWRENMSIVGISVSMTLNLLLAAAAITRLLLARRDLRREALPCGGGHYIRLCGLLAASTAFYTAGWFIVLIWRSEMAVVVALTVQVGILATTPLFVMLHATRREQGAANTSITLPPVTTLAVAEAEQVKTLSRAPSVLIEPRASERAGRRSRGVSVDYSTAAGCAPHRREADFHSLPGSPSPYSYS
ncbi:hypothetical protein AURDEDRAFT_141504 [Auricularia subglabra TFB-10046 SS5]|nr:hypothetical protein AURDEDRAFT_141504 [Auricularia subglabra TFB-10046 SS5]